LNPTKFSLHFSVFSTIFYAFYKFLQKEYTIEDASLPLGPWKEIWTRNWVPRPWEAAAPAEFWRASHAPYRGGGGARSHAHLGRGGDRGSSGDSSCRGTRRWPAVAPAAGCGSGGGCAMPSNGWRHMFLGLIGSRLGRLGALEKDGEQSSLAASNGGHGGAAVTARGGRGARFL
jgi:hypothetical protein